MSTDPRTELTRLLDALETHLDAVAHRTREHDPVIDEAYVEIANAFEAYENALFEVHNEVTPLSVYGDDDENVDEFLTDTDAEDDDIEYEKNSPHNQTLRPRILATRQNAGFLFTHHKHKTMSTPKYLRDYALILRTQNLGEADRIIIMLTQNNGVIHAVAKSIRKPNSKFGARLDP